MRSDWHCIHAPAQGEGGMSRGLLTWVFMAFALSHAVALAEAGRERTPSFSSGDWHYLGPFEWTKPGEGRLFWGDRPLPPDGPLNLRASFETLAGTVSWSAVPEWAVDGRVHSLESRPGWDDGSRCLAGYLYRAVESATDADALLYLGFDDGLVLTVNGERIFERFYYRDTHPRQEAIPIRLRAGRNDFLLKIINKDNTPPSSFCFELLPCVQPTPPLKRFAGGIGDLDPPEIRGGQVSFASRSGSLLLRLWRDNVVRITFVPVDAPWPYPSDQRPLPVAVSLADGPPLTRAADRDGAYLLEGDRLRIAVLKNGTGLWLESEGLRRYLEMAMSDTTDAGLQAIAALHLGTAESVYGTGERYDSLDRRGRANSIRNTDRAFGDSHFTLPYLTTRGGDALFFNTFGDGDILIDTPEAENVAFCRFQEAAIDLFYFAGTPRQRLSDWVDLTGHTVMPPDWALGVWMSRNSYENQEVVLQVAHELRKREIPSDVLVLEGWRGEGDNWMEWDYARWPDPKGLCRTLHEMGFRIVLWTMQYYPVNLQKPTAQQKEALEGRYFIQWDGKPWGWEENVFPVDFSNPLACAWWTRTHAPLFDPITGVDALKTDIGENVAGNTASGWSAINQRYALDYLRANFEMTRELTGEGVIFARTGTVGTQQYPILWAGDHSTWFQGMQEAYHAMLSAGLQGHAWVSFDVGGLYGDLDKETYIRMVQMGAFCPILQAHGQGVREPWVFDDETVDVFRRYAGWYRDLKDYRVAAGREAAETGVPILRPLWLDHPEDPECYTATFQYLFGPDILAAPIFSYNRTRAIYLPEGVWVDWWTGQTLKGRQQLTVDVPLDRMPLYVRGGSEVLGIAPFSKEAHHDRTP